MRRSRLDGTIEVLRVLRVLRVLMVLGVLASGCGTAATGPIVHDHQMIQHGAADRARVSIGMDAGDFSVTSGTTALMEADFTFNVPRLKPVISFDVANGEGVLDVSQQGGGVSGSYENKWQVKLNDQTPIDLRLNIGAGDAKFELGRLNLSRLSVNQGAGDLEVDLRGTPAKSYSASVQAGAGDTTVRVPLGVAISAVARGGIGDVTVTGLEQRNGRWINPSAVSSPVTIELTVNHGIGDLRLIAE